MSAVVTTVATWCLLAVGSAVVVALACSRSHPELGFGRSLLYASLSWAFGWVRSLAGLPARLRRFWALPRRARATRLVAAALLVLVIVSGVPLVRSDETGRVASDKVARDGFEPRADVLGRTEVRPDPGG